MNKKFKVTDFSLISMEGWRELAYIKEIIKGKQFEIKDLQRKLKKKWNKHVEIKEPKTPPKDE